MRFTKLLATFVTKRITFMNTRLKQFLAAENITQSEFADTIKVVRASVSHVLAGRNNPGYDFIKSIMTAYPNLNIEWLMLGEGRMYKSNLQNDGCSSTQKQSIEPESYGLLPFEDTEFEQKPGNIADFSTQEEEKCENKTIQVPVNQRKAVKVVVFYDDGSYQEL